MSLSYQLKMIDKSADRMERGVIHEMLAPKSRIPLRFIRATGLLEVQKLSSSVYSARSVI